MTIYIKIVTLTITTANSMHGSNLNSQQTPMSRPCGRAMGRSTLEYIEIKYHSIVLVRIAAETGCCAFAAATKWPPASENRGVGHCPYKTHLPISLALQELSPSNFVYRLAQYTRVIPQNIIARQTLVSELSLLQLNMK